MSCPGCFLSFETSAASSPLMRCELFHSSFFNVFEATYLGMLLNRSAKPSSSFRPGQAAANPSYVTRPRRSASVAWSSSDLNFPVSSLQNGKLHLSGASTTPSKVMNNVAARVRFAAIDFPPSLSVQCGTRGRYFSLRRWAHDMKLQGGIEPPTCALPKRRHPLMLEIARWRRPDKDDTRRLVGPFCTRPELFRPDLHLEFGGRIVDLGHKLDSVFELREAYSHRCRIARPCRGNSGK